MRTVFALSSLTLFIYLSATGLLYLFQRDFLYFPTEQYEHPYERMSVSSQDEAIDVIVLNKGNSKALVYFGGNGEAVVNNANEFAATFAETSVYLVNYRGYGASTGTPTEAGIYADALAIYDHIKINHSHVAVMGRSLGSGVATYLAANRSVDRIALITPYDSVLNVAKTQFPIFPVKRLLKDHYNSLSRAASIKSMVLVIAAEHDQIIPMHHTQRLINGFGDGQVSLTIIKKSTHNNLSNSPEYYQTLAGFLTEKDAK